MEKVKSIVKKMFNSKNKKNTIISLVALVQCVILIVMASYSWIETASSLIIVGNDLIITHGRNYDYKYNSSKKQMVDLSSYFIDSDHFSFAQASSADAQTFYFPYKVGDTTNYREGDTTDYNVTYYNFDFNAIATAGANFFFESDSIFSFTGNDYTDADGETVDISKDDKDAFLNAFRIAVSSDGGASKIFSKTGVDNTSAKKKATNGSITNATVKTEKIADYCYAAGNENVLFAADSDGTPVNIKIWLEEQDPDFKVLSNEKKEALLGASLRVEFNLVCTKVAFKKVTFTDYSLFTKDTSTNASMYYVVNGEYYPMTVTDSGATSSTWVTCNESGTPTSTIPSDVINLNSGYFAFATKDGNEYTDLCEWQPSGDVDSNNRYNAISATKTSESKITGYGYWDGIKLTRIKFADRTTYAGSSTFNSGAYQFIQKDTLYVVKDSIPVTMNYFANDDYYAAYVPSSWLSNTNESDGNVIPFVYTKNPYYNANQIIVKWNAAEQTASSTYTAIGYSTEDYLTKLSNAVGVGTWGDVEKINLSAELVDQTVMVSPNNRFRVGFNHNNENVKIYMSADSHNSLSYFAYIPKDSSLTFDYGQIKNSTKATFNAGAIDNSYSTYYLTNVNVNGAAGLWNLAVVVDGTIDNLINDTLDNVNKTGASLTYTVSGANPVNMTKVDNYRWITGDLSEKTLQQFTWQAYSEDMPEDMPDKYVDTVFEYPINSQIDGIYYLTITEDGTVVSYD